MHGEVGRSLGLVSAHEEKGQVTPTIVEGSCVQRNGRQTIRAPPGSHVISALRMASSWEQECGMRYSLFSGHVYPLDSSSYLLKSLILFLKIIYFHFMCIGVLPVWGIQSPGTGVTDQCELPCVCWKLDLGPVEEQLVFLTCEPSLQPLWWISYLVIPE